jgi:tetratricopeptide (TPR) repeat protein
MTRERNTEAASNPSFLLAKSSAHPRHISGNEPDKGGLGLLDFPDVPTGSTFTEMISATVEPLRAFGALLIRIDDFDRIGPSVDPESVEKTRSRIARAISAVSQPENGFWGVLDRALFGCLLPGKDGPSCLAVAENLKQTLLQFGAQTVTTGIAVYPTLDYTKDQILENAAKALEHAAFFGADSRVTFDAISLNISGDAKYDAGDIHGAIEEFKRAVMLDGRIANLHNSLGVCYGIVNDLESALREFETAIDLDPAESLAWFNAGLSKLFLEDRQKALEYFSKAAETDPHFFEAVLQAGKLHLDGNEALEAKPYLEKAVDLRRESGPAFSCLGECYAALGSTEDAQSAYKKALRLNANDAVALSGLGWLYIEQGKNPEIGKLFCQHSVEIAPENGLYRHRLGEIYFRENRLQNALDAFNQALKLGYDSREALENVTNLLSGNASETGS